MLNFHTFQDSLNYPFIIDVYLNSTGVREYILNEMKLVEACIKASIWSSSVLVNSTCTPEKIHILSCQMLYSTNIRAIVSAVIVDLSTFNFVLYILKLCCITCGFIIIILFTVNWLFYYYVMSFFISAKASCLKIHPVWY